MTDTDKLKRLAEALRGCLHITVEEHLTILALIAENERLTGCLREANKDTEHFERHWYLSCHERDEAVALLRPMADHALTLSSVFGSDEASEDYDRVRGFLARIDDKGSE